MTLANLLVSESYASCIILYALSDSTKKADKILSNNADRVDENAFLIEDYENDGEASGMTQTDEGAQTGLSAQTLDVLSQYVRPVG